MTSERLVPALDQRWPQFNDQPQNLGEQQSWHCDLG